jgi:hypothetical protein
VGGRLASDQLGSDDSQIVKRQEAVMTVMTVSDTDSRNRRQTIGQQTVRHSQTQSDTTVRPRRLAKQTATGEIDETNRQRRR